MGDGTQAVDPSWFARELEEGDTGPDVEVMQRKLGLPPTGVFDTETVKYVKGLQKKADMPMSGFLDHLLARFLGDRADVGMTPEWFTRPLALWDEGPDVAELRIALGFHDKDNRFDPELESAVRRHQSARGIVPTGRVSEKFTQSLR